MALGRHGAAVGRAAKVILAQGALAAAVLGQTAGIGGRLVDQPVDEAIGARGGQRGVGVMAGDGQGAGAHGNGGPGQIEREDYSLAEGPAGGGPAAGSGGTE